MRQAEVVEVYLKNMRDVKARLKYSGNLISEFNNAHDYLLLENAVLHIRKALECIAYASIAPNKKAYSKFRSSAPNHQLTSEKTIMVVEFLSSWERLIKNFILAH